MKILFIANAIVGENPGISGGEIRFIEIAKIWAKKGHEIHLMSSLGGETLCRNLGLDVILHNISNSKKKGRFVVILRALKSFFLLKSLNNFHEGVIYSTNEMISDVIPALRLKLKYRKKIKWITVVHWLPPFPPWKRKNSTFFNSIFFFINERISVWLANKFADVLLPVSFMTAKQLNDVGANMKKVYPVDCGVNYGLLRSISQEINEKNYDAVFMKRLQGVKGIFDLIEIWEIVIRVKPNAKLLVIGEGIDGQKAKEMVKKKCLDANIEFTGVVYETRDKIGKIVRSKLFLLPTYEENWAIAIGEAMAAGTPVIAYGLKELIDVWKDNFIQVPIGDKVHFAEKIIKMIDNPALLDEISYNGVEYVKRYDWQAIAEKELKIILGET